MRKIAFLLMVFFCSMAMLAGEITEQEAIQIARQFVPQSSSHQGEATAENSAVVYTQMMPETDRTAFYIVNVGDNAFVIVSADDKAEQVLGYSFSKRFPVKADGSLELPYHIKSFLNDLAAQVKAAANGSGRKSAIKRRRVSTRAANLPESVEPLVTTPGIRGNTTTPYVPRILKDLTVMCGPVVSPRLWHR